MKTSYVVGAIAVVVIIAGIWWYMGQSSTPSSTQTQQAQSGQAASAPAGPYTSSADGFAVNFPGTPDMGTSTFNSPSAGSISETDYTYVSSSNGKGLLYMIVVFHYPTTYQFSSNYLTGALQMFSTIINRKYPGTAVTAEPQSQFLSNAAISASVVVPFMGTPTPGNVLITTHNHNTYVVSAYGLSQSDYAAFQNSFTFTQ